MIDQLATIGLAGIGLGVIGVGLFFGLFVLLWLWETAETATAPLGRTLADILVAEEAERNARRNARRQREIDWVARIVYRVLMSVSWR